jgi:hypothetical protein
MFLSALHDLIPPQSFESYPNAAAIVRDNDPVEALLAVHLTASTFVVLMSVAHRLDMPAVQRLRRQPLRYLGMMGNRGRVAKCFAWDWDAWVLGWQTPREAHHREGASRSGWLLGPDGNAR